MTIKLKLVSSILCLAFALILASFVSFEGLKETSEKTRSIVVDRVVPLAQLKTIADMYAVKIVDTAHKVRSGALSWADGRKGVQEAASVIDSEWKAYMATKLTDEEQVLATRFIDARTTSASGIAVLSDILLREDQAALDVFVTAQLYPLIDPLAEPLDALIKLQLKVANEDYASATALKGGYEMLIAGVAVLSAVVAAFSLWVVLKGVCTPLQLLQRCMGRIADGELEITIFGADRRDEIGSMADAVEVFRKAGITNRRLEEEAAENRRKAQAQQIAAREKAEADAAERLRIATSGLAGGLRRLASGDLSFQLTEPFSADFEALRHDFNTSVTQLRDTLTAIARGASAIDSGTNEISLGATDLSRRSETQAASLEETAAALDELTTNVTSASRRADEARQVAKEANASAAKSGEVVSSAVDAMRRIEEASGKITNIIGVIDQIAFQTNLLALNAGVEAARAGDAGKGFAVVAQEVRELAQRSASAAKEIKGLIENSSLEVDSGVKFVSRAGESLKTIEGFIVTINQHVESIATSAREQSAGLLEINTAVNRMDQVTQQNAAMVEQTTAASAGLAQETTRLRDMVQQFKLDSDARGGSTRAGAFASQPRLALAG